MTSVETELLQTSSNSTAVKVTFTGAPNNNLSLTTSFCISENARTSWESSDQTNNEKFIFVLSCSKYLLLQPNRNNLSTTVDDGAITRKNVLRRQSLFPGKLKPHRWLIPTHSLMCVPFLGTDFIGKKQKFPFKIMRSQADNFYPIPIHVNKTLISITGTWNFRCLPKRWMNTA